MTVGKKLEKTRQAHGVGFGQGKEDSVIDCMTVTMLALNTQEIMHMPLAKTDSLLAITINYKTQLTKSFKNIGIQQPINKALTLEQKTSMKREHARHSAIEIWLYVEMRSRALYGHSIPCRVLKIPAQPPAVLFQSTSSRFTEQIKYAGLKPKGRQYVHLSVHQETALLVAKRKQGISFIIRVQASKAYQNGTKFYQGNKTT